VDLSNRQSLVWIFQHVSNIINRSFPFRWGIVPLLDTPEGMLLSSLTFNTARAEFITAEKAARIFYYVHRHYGPKEAMDFVRTVGVISCLRPGNRQFIILNSLLLLTRTEKRSISSLLMPSSTILASMSCLFFKSSWTNLYRTTMTPSLLARNYTLSSS
jgi:hypothetical protein